MTERSEATIHWLQQRATAMMSLPLMLWLSWSVAWMPGWSYYRFTEWVAIPSHGILMILAVLSVFWHTALGIQVVIEDYVHNKKLGVASLTAVRLLLAIATLVCMFCIVKICLNSWADIVWPGSPASQ